jgi:catechol 2,3-dioxygenase-like lactoylglutathione lyase family enzyme
MLSDATVFANLKAADLDAALDFYRDKLGLELVLDGDVMPGHREILFDVGGGIVCLEQGTAAGSGHTLVSFAVDDVDATVAALREKGVSFEDYNLPSLKTENGVATIGSLKAAWFKDPSGNLLAVTSSVTAMRGPN